MTGEVGAEAEVKLLFMLENQLKNAEGMMELEKSPLINYPDNQLGQKSLMD